MITKTYAVSGMTCSGCRDFVEDRLGGLAEVASVKVALDKKEASLTISEPIAIHKLQNTLGEKYRITEISKTNIFQTSNISEVKEKTKLQQLKPLGLIFIYLIGAVALINYDTWNMKEEMLDFMGLFFIVFSFFKMLDLRGFATSFKMYDPLARVLPGYALVYPFLETALGIMLLMRLEITIALVVTIVILGITTIGVTKSLLRKKKIKCACLGTVLKLPMTEATFIENTLMIAMAVFMLINLT